MIIPPKEIKAIVERTAEYVTRNGRVFEQRIRQKEQNNPKFSFLLEQDAYHDYFLSQLKASTERLSDSAETKPAPEPDRTEAFSDVQDMRFLAKMPFLCLNDLEVIRLVALFHSYIGRQFLTVLMQREMRSFQFEFLRPNHSFHQYFARLSDQYSLLGGTVYHKNTRRSRSEVLSSNKRRAQQHRASLAKEKEEEHRITSEKVAFAQIDWHDYILVETINFDESDEATDLPAPLELTTLRNLSLEAKMNSLSAELGYQHSRAAIQESRGAYENIERPSKRSGQFTVCPNCRSQVLIEELENHMKIELLNNPSS